MDDLPFIDLRLGQPATGPEGVLAGIPGDRRHLLHPLIHLAHPVLRFLVVPAHAHHPGQHRHRGACTGDLHPHAELPVPLDVRGVLDAHHQAVTPDLLEAHADRQALVGIRVVGDDRRVVVHARVARVEQQLPRLDVAERAAQVRVGDRGPFRGAAAALCPGAVPLRAVGRECGAHVARHKRVELRRLLWVLQGEGEGGDKQHDPWAGVAMRQRSLRRAPHASFAGFRGTFGGITIRGCMPRPSRIHPARRP